MTELGRAIVEARRIRRLLLRLAAKNESDPDLGGYCLLASILLATRLRNARTLRYAAQGPWVHVFNVVQGTVVDITATQFNDESDVRVRGVLVTPKRYWYHRPIAGSFRATVNLFLRERWYDRREYPRIDAAIRGAREL